MKFLDVFPYDKNDYYHVIYYFEESIGYYFQYILSEFAKGIACNPFPSCCLNLPHGDDNVMRKGPFACSGCPISKKEEEDYDVLDFKMFVVCFELAAKVYYLNSGNQVTTELKKLRRNYTDIEWIIEHCYGEEYYVNDNQCIYTGEHHGKEWGEEWYEKYGRFLSFDDVDEIVEAQFEKYYRTHLRRI